MAMSPLGAALAMQTPVQPTNKVSVAPTDVIGAYKNYQDELNTQYQAKLAQSNAMWGGLAGLGSAGILASKGKALSNLFGGDAATSATAPDLGYAVYDSGAPVGISGVAPFADAGATAATDATAAAVPLVDAGTATAFDSGAAAVPYLASADAGTAAAADLGSVAAADTAATVGTAAATDAGLSLADILPFLLMGA